LFVPSTRKVGHLKSSQARETTKHTLKFQPVHCYDWMEFLAMLMLSGDEEKSAPLLSNRQQFLATLGSIMQSCIHPVSSLLLVKPRKDQGRLVMLARKATLKPNTKSGSESSGVGHCNPGE
jgi:hypothetical protein